METFKERVGKNFKRLIEASHLPNKTIVEMVGVKEPTIYRWMNGKNTPDADTLDRLARILGVKPSDFFEVDREPAPLALPMSKIAARIAAVPDEVYIYGEKIGNGHEVWRKVRLLLDDAAKEIETKAKKA